MSDKQLPENNNLNELQVDILFLSLTEKLNTFKTLFKDIHYDVILLEKKILKSFKGLHKQIDKKKKSKKNPSGFAQPTIVTDELCQFLNMTEGSKMARTEVTKAIIQYIKSNNLQDQSNRKKILPDDRLKFLLGLDQDELDFFSLQKYMNKHFIAPIKNIENKEI
jgi:chromatin remodeling complex protein RSC6